MRKIALTANLIINTLMWMDTRYEPGTLKVVAYDEQGNAVAEEEVHTAGKPHHIELKADRTNI